MDDRHLFTVKSFIVLILGMTVYLLFLYFFIGFEKILEVIKYANITFYFLAFISSIINVFFHSLIWHDLLNTLSIKTHLKKIFSFVWIGNLVDIIIPAESISGEITKIYLARKSFSKNTGGITASILSHRMLYTMISLIILLTVSSIFMLEYTVLISLQIIILIISVGALASIIFFLTISFKKNITDKLVDYFFVLINFFFRKKRGLNKFKPTIKKILTVFHESIEFFQKNPKKLVKPTFFSLIAWTSKMSITLMVFISLGITAPLIGIIVIFSLTDAIQSVPIGIPGEVGIMEIVMTGLYTMLGISTNLSATATLLIRIITLWFSVLIGFIMTLNLRFKKIEY